MIWARVGVMDRCNGNDISGPLVVHLWSERDAPCAGAEWWMGAWCFGRIRHMDFRSDKQAPVAGRG